jgi:hypothetical protein
MQVKDLEVELEATKQKGRDTLQQAILAERERITQMQWDMDELRRKYSEMESNLKIEQVSFPPWSCCFAFLVYRIMRILIILLHFICRMRKFVWSQRKQLPVVKEKSWSRNSKINEKKLKVCSVNL